MSSRELWIIKNYLTNKIFFQADGGGGGEGEHSFLLLSREDSTMVNSRFYVLYLLHHPPLPPSLPPPLPLSSPSLSLSLSPPSLPLSPSPSFSLQVLQTGQEITELDSSGFATQCPTLHTANMGGGRFMIQVRKLIIIVRFHIFNNFLLTVCVCVCVCEGDWCRCEAAERYQAPLSHTSRHGGRSQVVWCDWLLRYRSIGQWHRSPPGATAIQQKKCWRSNFEPLLAWAGKGAEDQFIIDVHGH